MRSPSELGNKKNLQERPSTLLPVKELRGAVKGTDEAAGIDGEPREKAELPVETVKRPKDKVLWLFVKVK